jgi:predicted nucleic acid-binding protein
MGLDSAVLALTPFTIGEMTFGALKNNWSGDRFRRLENHLRAFQVIGVDAEVGSLFGQLFLACRRAGREKGDWNGCIDLWIASVAIRHDLPLATLDDGFDDIPGVRLLRRDGSETVTKPFSQN